MNVRVGFISVTMTLLFTAAVLPASATTEEEAAHSPNVKQIGRVEMKLPNGEPWETGYMAFQGDILVVGSGYDQYTEDAPTEDLSVAKGFGIFRILPRAPYLKQISFFRCASGRQGDISIWKQYVFLSVTAATTNDYSSDTCNNTDDSAGKVGIRVVDISDPRRPRQVKFIETSCGSQMHSIVPGEDGALYIYDAHRTCPTGAATPSFRMEVVRFDPEHPRRAEVATAPSLGDTQDGCMDIAIFMPRRLAACMSLHHATLYDISDPLNPEPLYEIVPPGAVNMNAAGFSWDGEVLVLSDQGEGGGFSATCSGEASATDLFFYKLYSESTPTLLGKYEAERLVIPGPGKRITTCMTWDFTIVPTRDRSRYVAALGFLSGGMSLVDFTDPEAAKEIAFHMATDGELSISDIGHTYWYRGRFYAGEWQTRKGIRIMKVEDFTRETMRDMWRYNPQTQVR